MPYTGRPRRRADGCPEPAMRQSRKGAASRSLQGERHRIRDGGGLWGCRL